MAITLLILAAATELPAQQEVAAVPYVPTSMAVVNAMLSLAEVAEDDVLYDLGSGDGRIVVTAADRLGTRGVGFEIIPWLVEQSYRNADSAGVRDLVQFESQDLFEADYTSASIVTLYLSAEFNLRLRPVLLRSLRPGARVVSHAFHMREWEPDSTVTVGTGASRATIFLWIVPADVDGFWSLRIDGEPVYALELNQQFQKLEGAARRDEESTRLFGGTVRGQRVEFTLPGAPGTLRFVGELEDGRISGTVTGPAGYRARRWTAVRFSDAELRPLRDSEAHIELPRELDDE